MPTFKSDCIVSRLQQFPIADLTVLREFKALFGMSRFCDGFGSFGHAESI